SPSKTSSRTTTWALNTDAPLVIDHTCTSCTPTTPGAASALLAHLDECLDEHFDVAHSTFQLEPQGHERRESVHP
ncbi:MAG: hypothetical protein RIA38_01575, partial [Microcella pacifica]